MSHTRPHTSPPASWRIYPANPPSLHPTCPALPAGIPTFAHPAQKPISAPKPVPDSNCKHAAPATTHHLPKSTFLHGTVPSRTEKTSTHLLVLQVGVLQLLVALVREGDHIAVVGALARQHALARGCGRAVGSGRGAGRGGVGQRGRGGVRRAARLLHAACLGSCLDRAAGRLQSRCMCAGAPCSEEAPRPPPHRPPTIEPTCCSVAGPAPVYPACSYPACTARRATAELSPPLQRSSALTLHRQPLRPHRRADAQALERLSHPAEGGLQADGRLQHVRHSYLLPSACCPVPEECVLKAIFHAGGPAEVELRRMNGRTAFLYRRWLGEPSCCIPPGDQTKKHGPVRCAAWAPRPALGAHRLQLRGGEARAPGARCRSQGSSRGPPGGVN